MSNTFSRRVFLKGAAAAALAVSVSGLTGCSAGGNESPTAVVLGDYKVDVDMGKSVLGKNGDGGATLKLSVTITNNDAGAVATPFVSKVFPSMKAGDTELTMTNSKSEVITLPIKTPIESNPTFKIEDADLYKKVNEGTVDLKLTVKLSSQTAVYTLNFGSGTKSVEKA